MNKQELIQAASAHSGMSQVDVKKALNSLEEVMVKSLQKEESVTLIGFGSFQVLERSARQGYNLQTGQKIQIESKKVIKFKPGNRLCLTSNK